MSYESPGARLRHLWAKLAPLPGGRWLFSKLLGVIVPYTGRMGPVVEVFEPGHVVARLRDRRAVRNHLRSVHAMALANLGELATGLAVLGAMPATVRGILVGYDMKYTKKARGVIRAEAQCAIPEVAEPVEYRVEATITDDDGDVVAIANATWLLGPVPDRSQ